MLGSYAGSGLPAGTNQTWLSLYSPLTLLRAVRSGDTATMTSTPELGMHAYSAYVDVPPGGTTTMILTLEGRVTPGDRYGITLRQQPMVNPQHVTVTVSGSSGAKGETWVAGARAVVSHSFVVHS